MTVAVVYSETDEGRAALQAAIDEARLRATELAVLYVPDSDEPVAEEVEVAVSATVRERLSGFDGETSIHFASRGRNVAGAIVDLTAEVGASLLVQGSRRRTATGKFLLGSTVQRVLLDSTVPVLTVKAPE